MLSTLTNRISAVRDPRLKSHSRDPRLALKNKRRANTPLASCSSIHHDSSRIDSSRMSNNQEMSSVKKKHVRRVHFADNCGKELELCRTIHNCLSSRGFRPSCAQLLLACKNKLAAQTREHRARKRARIESTQNPEAFAFAAGDSVVHRDRGIGHISELTADHKLHVKFESERKVFVYSLRELQRDNKLTKSESPKRPRLESTSTKNSQETEPLHSQENNTEPPHKQSKHRRSDEQPMHVDFSSCLAPYTTGTDSAYERNQLDVVCSYSHGVPCSSDEEQSQESCNDQTLISNVELAPTLQVNVAHCVPFLSELSRVHWSSVESACHLFLECLCCAVLCCLALGHQSLNEIEIQSICLVSRVSSLCSISHNSIDVETTSCSNHHLVIDDIFS